MQTNTEETASNPQEEASSKQQQNKIDHLERIIKNLTDHWNTAEKVTRRLIGPIPINDERLVNAIITLNQSIALFIEEMRNVDVKQTLAEIKFIGKRLDAIEKSIEKISKDGVDRHVKLDLTLDGYKMVKKQINHDPEVPIEDSNNALDELLKDLTDKQRQTITFRFGLYGEKPHTQAETARKMKVSAERIRQMCARSLRLLRHPCRKKLVEKINHRALYKGITGNEIDDKEIS